MRYALIETRSQFNDPVDRVQSVRLFFFKKNAMQAASQELEVFAASSIVRVTAKVDGNNTHHSVIMPASKIRISYTVSKVSQ